LTSGLAVQVTTTLPSPATAESADGGAAEDPLLEHPPSNGDANAAIKMQNDLFTVGFLEWGFIPLR
jgi:hypothetical protein